MKNIIATLTLALCCLSSAHANEQVSRLHVQIMDMESQIRQLNGRLEEMQFQINQLEKKNQKHIADVDFRLNQLENKKSLVTRAPVDNPKTSEIGPIDITPTAENLSGENTPIDGITIPSSQYELAFAALRDKNYDGAEAQFKAFIRENPGHELLSNAHYWLGESFYARSDYKKAAVHFLKGYQDYPKGFKRPDNLLKLSLSLDALGQHDQSCATLTKLLEEFGESNSDVITKAKDYQSSLSCS